MSTVHYTAPDILHWLGTPADRPKAKSRQTPEPKSSASSEIAANIKAVASAATSFGKEAIADIVRAKVSVYKVSLYEKGMEIYSLTATRKIDYENVKSIKELTNDRFEIVHENGKAIIKPCGHIVVERLKLPIGWIRNGLEVSYHTLIQEIAARSSIEISKR